MLNAAYLRSEKISQIFMCFRMLVLVPMLVFVVFMLVFVPMLMFMFMFMFMPKMSIITSKSTVSCTFTSVRYLNLDENYV